MRIIAFYSKDVKSPRKRQKSVNYIFPGKTRNPAEELKRKCCTQEAGGEWGGLRGVCSGPAGQPPALWPGHAEQGTACCTGHRLGWPGEVAGSWPW